MEIRMSRTVRLAIAAAAVALVPAAASANQSGTIRLQGNVPLNCVVAVTDNNVALNLVSGETNRAVGTVVETCNSGVGYTISISSGNGGTMVSTGAGTVPVDYNVSYDNSASELASPLALARNGAQFNRSTNLLVNIPASSSRIAGDYQDTVTITIAAQ